MVRNITALLIISLMISSCGSTNKNSAGKPAGSSLDGTWELNYISGPRIAFDGLYPNKKPTLTFDVANKKVSGNTSCNNFNGVLKLNGNNIDFNDNMALTKMMCEGSGENVFLETLKKVNTWSVSEGNTLNLIMGDIAIMRFSKK
jgi:heat shock protein HslJ